MLRRGVLRGVVADALDRRHEAHRRRGSPCQPLGVVARAGGHTAARVTEACRDAGDARGDARVEGDRLKTGATSRLDRDAFVAAKLSKERGEPRSASFSKVTSVLRRSTVTLARAAIRLIRCGCSVTDPIVHTGLPPMSRASVRRNAPIAAGQYPASSRSGIGVEHRVLLDVQLDVRARPVQRQRGLAAEVDAHQAMAAHSPAAVACV
jgi:hypothetical protein